MSVYTIIVTYNGEEWISKCLNSLVNSSVQTNILVIDNCSTDKTVDIIEEQFPQVELIKSDENLGFGKANNIGLKRVLDENVDFAFLLNQDAWVENDTIEKLIDISEANPDIGILSPVPYNGDGSKYDRQFEKFYSKPYTIAEIENEQDVKPYIVEFINAAGWLLPLGTIKKVGFFHPLFFQRSEDRDYVNRCIYHKIKSCFVTNTKYYHDREAQLGKPYNEKQYINSFENRLKLMYNDINHSYITRVKLGVYTFTRYNKLYDIRLYKLLVSYIITSLKVPLIFLRSEKLKKSFM